MDERKGRPSMARNLPRAHCLAPQGRATAHPALALDRRPSLGVAL